jgi:heat shock protein HtpX
MAVSRQREYLADASSVELTRNPYGLERALAKIASDKEVLEVANRATQHLYFVNPIKKWEARSGGLMQTHPPIVDRINRLRALTGHGSTGHCRARGPRLTVVQYRRSLPRPNGLDAPR